MKRTEVITIDGSQGEGGGQVLRTSLALSLVTGKPFRITNIRAGRKKPGLLRQHLTAVNAAQAISDAAFDGAEIGSRELVFRPGEVKPGEYRFAVGTAGSTSLVLQTILPVLMLANRPSRLTLEGGTHNPFAPPFDFLERTFLPQLAKFGPSIEAKLIRPGFYPAGGGRLDVTTLPSSSLHSVDVLERGADQGRRLIAHLAGLPRSIAERAFEQAAKRLGWSHSCMEVVEHLPESGPGFVLVAEVASEGITEVFTGFGERSVRAEQVADGVIDRVRQYLAHTAPVAEYLADQLLLPLALAGRGSIRTLGLSPHARTNLDVISRFVPAQLEILPGDAGSGTIVRLNSQA